jgi:hypothetical protein
MSSISYPMKKYLKLLTIALSLPFFALLFTDHWRTAAQTTQTPKVETAGQKFKNIKVLNDMPADQLGKVMNVVSASLGVNCSFCHVGEDFEKDDKRNKLTARKMMAMTLDINKSNFNNRPQVSCNTCHNGHEQPQNVPNLNPEPEPARPAQPTEKPTVDQIIDKYLIALGGAAKLATIKTRYIKANRVEPGGEVVEPETIWFDANKYTLATTYEKATVSEGFDGATAWKATTTGPIELKPDEIEQIKREADLFTPQNIKTIYPKMDFRFVDLINGKPAYLVVATTAGGTRERLYFDVQTGLLVRRAATTPTMLGNFVYQVDYSDYKLLGGAKVPTTIEYAVPNIRWTRKIIQVKNNVPVDATKFNAPSNKG